MRISVIAAIGKRGQLGLTSGGIPWYCKEDLKEFAAVTRGCTMIAGYRTYELITPILSQEKLATSNRKLICWNSRIESPNGVLAKLKHAGCEHVWIIGGAATYESFFEFLNYEIRINVVSYDNDPAEDAEHVFFPLDAYGIRLTAS